MPTSEVVDQMTSPEWLQARRRVAQERAEEAGLPSAEQEIWRYSPIADLDLSRYSLVEHASAAVDEAGLVSDETIADAVAVVDLVDGHLVGLDLRDGSAKGVVIERVADAVDGEEILGAAFTGTPDMFTDMNIAFSHDPLVVRIARGAVIEGPVVIRHRLRTDNALVCSRVIVIAGENSEATVVEVQYSGDQPGLAIPVTELVVEPAARLRYLAVQDLGSSIWQLGSQMATIDRDGYLLASTVALGGKYARVRTDTRMIGRGAEGDIMAVYFGDGDQTLDFRTFQQHVAPDTRSNLTFKGALDDRARSIYTGLIRIEKEASGVVAFQTNRNIKLSNEAWSESVPNLEIENNDVKCSHASAVGPIDADQRFYLESRGVPTQVAERLVVQGFFREILEQIPHGGIAARVEAELTRRLQVGGDS